MPCGCLAVLLGCPRLAIFITWFVGWFGPQFETSLWPLVGFFLMPWTTFGYACCMTYFGPAEQAPVPWAIIMVLSVSADLGTHGGSERYRRRRYQEC